MTEASSRPWALVTGGSRGLGAATAVALARRGFSIALGHHRHAAAPVADAVMAAGAEVLPLRFDVTDPKGIEVAFATLGEHLQAHDGALEALVCAAGITHDTLLGASAPPTSTPSWRSTSGAWSTAAARPPAG